MAESKNRNTTGAETAAPEETTAAPVETGEELVDYFAPFLPGENRQDIFVAVNGESLVIKRGVAVKIKRKFHEVLMHAQEQELSAYQAMETAKKQGERALTNM